MSTENGTRFGSPLNLSKNEKFSKWPAIATAGDNIYVVWEDLTLGNHELLYTKGSKM